MSLKVNYDKVSDSTEAYEAVKGHITPELIEKFKVKAMDELLEFARNYCTSDKPPIRE